MRIVLPQYVHACRLIAQRQNVRFSTALGRVRVTFDTQAVRRGRVEPRYSHRIETDRAFSRNAGDNRRHIILSVCVHEQDARRMPVDCQLSLMQAPRPFVVQRTRSIGSLNEELATDGVAFMNEPCSLVFSSLDAIDFDETVLIDSDGVVAATESMSATPRQSASVGAVAVPRCYPHAALLRQVVMAQQLMNMDHLVRASATRASLHAAPLQGTDVWLYPNARVLYDAVNFIQQRLVPPTRRRYNPQNIHIVARPLVPGSETVSWATYLSSHVTDDSPRFFEFTVQFIMHLASVPDIDQ